MRYLIAILIGIPSSASFSAVFKYELASGKIKYQASPCNTGKSMLLNVCGASPASDGLSFPPRPDSQQVEVVGDQEFLARVYEALALLKAHGVARVSHVSHDIGELWL